MRLGSVGGPSSPLNSPRQLQSQVDGAGIPLVDSVKIDDVKQAIKSYVMGDVCNAPG